MSVRAFPMPVFPPEGRPENWCRWCGEEIVHGRAASRSWHDGRLDEPKCKLAWELHTDRRVQFPYVVERDGLKCWDCGESPEKWIRAQDPSYHPPFRIPAAERACFVGEWWKVTRATALEMEHSTPLWAVAHLPDDERRFYFGPFNLRLRCAKCHGAKSKAEARDRAHMKRLEAKRLEIENDAREAPNAPAWPTRKLQSRGFAKGHRPLRSRNDLAKKKPRR